MNEISTATQLTQVIDHLAGKLAVPAEQLFDVLIKQAYVQAFKEFAVAILLGFILWGLYRPLRAFWVSWEKREKQLLLDEPIGPVLCSVAYGIVALVTVVQLVVAITCLIQLANPEYAALEMIAKAFTGGIR